MPLAASVAVVFGGFVDAAEVSATGPALRGGPQQRLTVDRGVLQRGRRRRLLSFTRRRRRREATSGDVVVAAVGHRHLLGVGPRRVASHLRCNRFTFFDPSELVSYFPKRTFFIYKFFKYKRKPWHFFEQQTNSF